MKLYFDTTIDCKACLDNVLLEFLNYTNEKGLFWGTNENNRYIIVIDTDAKIKTLKTLLSEKHGVEIKIMHEKILTELDYQQIKEKLHLYTKSFFD